MSDEGKSQPDPMSDIGDVDIDSLLEKTSELAAKAGDEVGSDEPESAEETEAPADDQVAPESERQDAIDPEAESAETATPMAEKPPPAEAVPEEDDTASAEGGDENIDGQLAELEALLGGVSEEPGGPARETQAPLKKEDAGATYGDGTSVGDGQPQAPPPTEANTTGSPADDLPDFEDYDDFDISVDLSDEDEKIADQELAQKAGTQGQTTTHVEAAVALPLPARVAASPITALKWGFLLLDKPFAGMKTETKQAMGYVAIVTLLTAVGGIVYGSLAY